MARRLLVPVTLLFLVLLILGSLAPTDSTREDTTPTPPPPADTPPPRTVEVTLPGQEARAQVGDLVTLTVESDAIGGVSLPDFGETEPVAPGSPALFDVLPTVAGRFPVRDAVTGKQIGVLVVDEADEPAEPETTPAPEPDAPPPDDPA
jgi:hypothetical protein